MDVILIERGNGTDGQCPLAADFGSLTLLTLFGPHTDMDGQMNVSATNRMLGAKPTCVSPGNMSNLRLKGTAGLGKPVGISDSIALAFTDSATGRHWSDEE